MYPLSTIKFAAVAAVIVTSFSFLPPAEVVAATPAAKPTDLLVVDAGHGDDVNYLAYSPDSRFFASASNDRTIILHRSADGAWAKTLRGVTAGINCLAFAPNSTVLASGGSDNSVLIWDINTGTILRNCTAGSFTEDEGKNGTARVAFSSDGKILASASDGGVVRLWDVNTGALLRSVTTSLGQPTLLTFATDSKSFFVGEEGNSLQSWNTQSGTLQRTFDAADLPGVPMAISNDGLKIALRTTTGQILTWDVTTSKTIATATPPRPLKSVAFSPDGKALIGLLSPNLLVAWNEKGEIFQAFETGIDMSVLAISSFASSPDGKAVATANRNGVIKVWELATGKIQARRAPFRLQATQVLYGKNRIISGYDDGSLLVWDIVTGKLQKSIRNSGRKVVAAALSPDGSTLAVLLGWNSFTSTMETQGVANQEIQFWDTGTWTQGRTIKIVDFRMSATSLAFSPDGQTLAAGSISYDEVRLWDVKSGQQKWELGQNGSLDPQAIAFSPDGKLFASSSNSGTGLQVWKLEDQTTLIKNLNGSSTKVRGLTFLPQGQIVVTSNYGLRLFDIATQKWLPNIEKVSEEGINLVLSPDGSALANSTKAGNVKLWDTAGWKFKSYLQGDDLHISEVAFAGNKKLVTNSSDGSIKVWDSSDGHLLATLQVLPNTSDNAEWITYTPRGAYIGSPNAAKFVHLSDGTNTSAGEIETKYLRPADVQKALSQTP